MPINRNTNSLPLLVGFDVVASVAVENPVVVAIFLTSDGWLGGCRITKRRKRTVVVENVEKERLVRRQLRLRSPLHFVSRIMQVCFPCVLSSSSSPRFGSVTPSATVVCPRDMLSVDVLFLS